jgi:uncharacterized protein YjgD (DUF1641 family)
MAETAARNTASPPFDPAALADEVRSIRAAVDALTEQGTYLTARAKAQELRQREWDDLKADLAPITDDLYAVAVDELAELEPHVRLDDILRLLKRLARDTRALEVMLERMESANDFLADAMPLANEVFHQAVDVLGSLEQRGYFRFARESNRVMDAVVASYSEEELGALADNMGAVVGAVKGITQPEVMALTREVCESYRQELQAPKSGTPGLIGLLRQLGDPQVRRGLSVGLAVMRAIGSQAADAAADGDQNGLPGPESPELPGHPNSHVKHEGRLE